MKGHAIAAVVWLGLVAAGYVAFDRLTGHAEPVSGCDGGRAPAEIVVPAARDGHFYLDGAVNGAPVRFLVDTGASYVTVNERVAGVARFAGGVPANFETAACRRAGSGWTSPASPWRGSTWPSTPAWATWACWARTSCAGSKWCRPATSSACGCADPAAPPGPALNPARTPRHPGRGNPPPPRPPAPGSDPGSQSGSPVRS